MCYDESYNYESFIDSVFSAGDPAANITAFFVCNSIIGGHTRVLDLRGDGQAEIVSGDLVLKAAGKTIRDGAGKNLLPAYKAYRAIISQSEFGMVTVHEGENHTGAAITWGSDVAPGVIIGTADAPIFDVTKTFVNIGPIPQDPQLGNNYDVGYFIVSPTQIKVSSWWKQAGMLDQLIDGVLTNTPIEILNYP
jgi:hypothetical protein